MAQLRAKQIKLVAAGDLLVGGTGGTGTVLTKGAEATVLKVLAGGVLGYAKQVAQDVEFSEAGYDATNVKAAILEAAANAAAAVDAEAARATAAEATLTTAIADEAARATAAEDALTADLAAEVARATGEEARIEGLVTAEATARAAADTAEATARAAADTALGGRIDAVNTAAGLTGDAYVAAEAYDASTAPQGVHYISGAISLFDADKLLDAKIKEVSLLAGTGTAGVQAELDATQAAVGLAANGTLVAFATGGYAEGKTTFKAAIDAIDAALKAEETARADADSALSTALGNEVTARTNADTALQTAIDNLTAADIAFTGFGTGGKVEGALNDLDARVDALTGLNALHFVGELAHNGTLPATPAQGDVYRVSSGAVDFLGTGLEVNAGDFIAYAGNDEWVKFDNTDPGITAGTNITVTGGAHEGWTVGLSGVVATANGGTGLSSVGSNGQVLMASNGALQYVYVGSLVTSTGTVVAGINDDEKLAARAAHVTVDADSALAYTTKGWVEGKLSSAASAGARSEKTEDFTVGANPAANYSFSLAAAPVGDVSVFFNGIKLKKTAYTVAGQLVTLADATVGYAAEEGDVLSAIYMVNA